MKRTLRTLAALAAAILLLLYAVFAGADDIPHTFTSYSTLNEKTQRLCVGVRLTEYRLKSDLLDIKEKRQHLFVLDLDPRENSGLTLAIGLKNGYVHGLMTLPAAAQYAIPAEGMIVAGVNGDFFDMASGGPLGHTMAEGRWITSGEFENGWALGVTSTGEVRIGRPGLALSLTARRGGEAVLVDIVINALNCLRMDIPPAKSTPQNAYQSRLDNALVLYTRDYYTSTMAADGGYEVLFHTQDDVRSGQILTGTVSELHDEHADTRAGTLKIPQGMPLKYDTMVLSGIGKGAEALRLLTVGDTVSIACAVDSCWADIVTCLGGGRPDGGPLLVYNGEMSPENTTVSDYAYFYSSNPRTIAGVRDDGTYFLLVAEGYQTNVSSGLTIAEASLLALDLNAKYALNLDGGPSSTMAIREGKGLSVISNATGRGHVTAVGNSLYVVIKDK